MAIAAAVFITKGTAARVMELLCVICILVKYCCVHTASSHSSSSGLTHLYIVTSCARFYVCLHMSLSCSCIAEINMFRVLWSRFSLLSMLFYLYGPLVQIEQSVWCVCVSGQLFERNDIVIFCMMARLTVVTII